MEVTLRNILDAERLLSAISNERLRSKATYQIARILREIRNEIDLFNEKRMELIDKYGEHDETGNLIIEEGNYKIKPENGEAMNNEYVELLDTKLTLNANPIQLTLLDDNELKLFTPNDMIKLLPFIEE